MQEVARLEKTVNGLELVLFYLCFFLFSPAFKGFVWWKWDLDNAGETHRVERHFFNVSAFIRKHGEHGSMYCIYL